MSGYVAIHRSLFTSPGLKRGQFCEHAAWMWLIAEAAWKPTEKRIGSTAFKLERGQCAHALRFMAKAWMWDKNRVVRFLARLRDDSMITTFPGREATLITICKYEEYQPSRDADAPSNGTQTGRERDKLEEDNNRIKERAAPDGAEDVVVDLYAFKGRIVKVNPDQYERWRKNYESIELRDELALADDYYFENPTKDGKWFFQVASWLERANKRGREARKNDLRNRGEAW